MPSVHSQPDKPNLFCAFYDPEGFRKFKTTGTANRRIATTICTALQRASDLARTGRLSSEKALKLLRETCAAIEESHGKLQADAAHTVLKSNFEEFVKQAGGELESYTIRTWLDGWLNGKTLASKATVTEYRRIVDLFLKHLGARAGRSLTTLQSKQIEDFKAYLMSRVSPSTVNKAVKVLKASLSEAVKRRLLEFSPAEHVAPVDTEAGSRRPFTDAELSALLKAANSEWRTMILVGFYTGLRLRDCANLTWDKVNLLSAVIDVTPEKTRHRPNPKRLQIPIAEPLLKHLNTLAGDNPNAPLCPEFAGKSASWLSNQFHGVMVAAGLVTARDPKKKSKGKGRSGRRDSSRISFHSLRYNTTSGLRSSGVSESVAMDIVGHETAAVHRSYGKTAIEAKREAVNKLPDITR